MAFALRANAGPRFLSGFLIMFMAFLLRENPIGEWRTEVLLAIVLGGAGLGNAVGIFVGSLLRRVDPPLLVVLALAADTVVVLVAALFYGVVVLGLLGLTAGLAQSLAKLALDSTIQRDVPERVQSSAFARSDATLQLAWVVGGFVGIALPLMPRLGLGVAAGVLAAWSVFVLVRRRAESERDCGVWYQTPHLRPRRMRSGTKPRRVGLLELQLVGERAEQLRGRLGGARVGVAAVAVALTDAVEQRDQVLDDRDHLLGPLAARVGLVAGDGGLRLEHPHLERLLTAPALGDPELHPGAGLQRGGALRQRLGAHVDVVPALLGEEAESLLGVVPLHLASRHGRPFLAHRRGAVPQERPSLWGRPNP